MKADDVEFGCYATLKKFKSEGEVEIRYLLLTLGGDAGDKEVRKQEQLQAARSLTTAVEIADLPSAYLNNDSGRATIKAIETAIGNFSPDIIFSHSSHDRHQDHRLVNQATVSACRFYKGTLLFYEGYSALKYFEPNCIHIVDDWFDEKVKIMSTFSSQASKFYIRPEVISAIATFRAAQFGHLGKAEAFEVGGIVL